MQLSYTQYQNAGIRGLLYDLRNNDCMSYSAQGAVPVGVPVAYGTNKERQCVPAITAVGMGALAFGVSVLQADHEQAADGTITYADKETVSVMKEGRIWVDTNDAVTAGNVANLHLATGRFTDDAVGAGIEAFTQFRARFITSTTAAGLAVVEIVPI